MRTITRGERDQMKAWAIKVIEKIEELEILEAELVKRETENKKLESENASLEVEIAQLKKAIHLFKCVVCGLGRHVFTDHQFEQNPTTEV